MVMDHVERKNDDDLYDIRRVKNTARIWSLVNSL